MNELTEGIEALAEKRDMTRDQLLKDYAAIIDRCKKESHDIEQMLGEVLGYPWYKDDQENFPNATEADGVCVGHETAWSLAANAAYWLKKYKEENQKLREGLSLVASNIRNGSGASPQASVEFLTVDVPAEVKLVCQNYRTEIEFLKAKFK
jgi:hypothetical protein